MGLGCPKWSCIELACLLLTTHVALAMQSDEERCGCMGVTVFYSYFCVGGHIEGKSVHKWLLSGVVLAQVLSTQMNASQAHINKTGVTNCICITSAS